jgi:hypothetical protein
VFGEGIGEGKGANRLENRKKGRREGRDTKKRRRPGSRQIGRELAGIDPNECDWEHPESRKWLQVNSCSLGSI